MAAVHPEVELTYAADDAFELPSLTRLLSGASTAGGVPLAEGVADRHRLDAVYFDTDDLRLAAAGLTLRRRTGGDDAGWHLKVPAGTATRSEVRLPPGRVPPGRTPRAVPDELRSMVWAQTLGRPLQPVARITTERTVVRVSDPTGQVLVEVADDRVTARRLSHLDGAGEAVGAATSWREIEVELVDGAPELLDVLDRRLRRSGLERSPSASKLAHALGGSTPRDAARRRERTTKRELTRSSTAGKVVTAHVRRQVARIRGQDLPVRLDVPGSVHRMRVATRRLRSALRTFGPLFDLTVVGPLGRELRWLAGELGAARDAEVMRDRVRAALRAEDAESGVLAGADAALAELDRTYRAAHDRVLAELGGDRYRALLTMLGALVERPPLSKAAKSPAGTALPRLVARSHARVSRLVDRAGAAPAGAEQDELLHDARKAAKRARYAGEAVAPVLGEDATAYATAMEGVQEALGERQDSLVTRERLHALAVAAGSTEVAFLYGRLHAREEARAGRTTTRFEEAWKAAARKRVTRWFG